MRELQTGKKFFMIYVLKLKQEEIKRINKDFSESPTAIFQNRKDYKYLFEYSVHSNFESKEFSESNSEITKN